MADLLSSSALALAALAMFLNLWLPGIVEAAKTEVPSALRAADAKPRLEKMRPVLRGQALPLVVASVATFLALSQPAIEVMWESLKHFNNDRAESLEDYDAVRALFVVVWLLTGLLVFVILKHTRHLVGRVHAMKERVKESG